VGGGPLSTVVIFGTGMMARRLWAYFEKDSDDEVVAFTVDGEHLNERSLLGLPVVPFEELENGFPPGTCEICVSVGYRDVNQARARACERCLARGYTLASYISSIAHRFEPSTIGTSNTLLLERVTVQPFATVGDDVILMGCSVGHEATVGDHCFIAGGAVVGGGATIGPYCFVGMNATIRNEITIAPRCVIGAGAVIKEDTEEGEVYSARATEPLGIKSWDLRDL
jgi:sugar O-acyltransferase (sialic acid O-acetyltransferase NeuD family)